jgi:hypothetical protein
MKNGFKVILLSLTILVSTNFSQGEAAVPFLVLQQSPQFTGAAQVGVAVPPIDPMGFYLNPAVLGETSQEFNFTTLFLPSKVDWLNFGRIEFSTFGMSLGYNFKNSFLKIPLSIGIGYIKNRLDYGEFVRMGPESPDPISSFDSYDEFSSLSFGVSYEFYLKFSAGITTKSFKSVLSDSPSESEPGKRKAEGNAFDYGFLITAPISKLFYDDVVFNVKDNWNIKPKTNISLGYSLTNIGDEINYIDQAQSDPIPRTARLGYNINLGFDLVSDNLKFNLLDYYFIAEAEDILIEKNEANDYKTEYQSGFGDISFGDNVISLKGDEKVVVRKAHMFRILETISFSIGRFDGRGYYEIRKTDGLIISTTGISKYLSSNFDNDILQFIADHISIEYYHSTLFVDWWETEIEGIGIILKNFSF